MSRGSVQNNDGLLETTAKQTLAHEGGSEVDRRIMSLPAYILGPHWLRGKPDFKMV